MNLDKNFEFFMPSLKLVNKKMICNGYKRSTFYVEFNHKTFSCIFIIDTIPYQLYISTLGVAPFTFQVDILKGYKINPILDNEIYRALIEYLELKYDPKKKFSPIAFFDHINKKLPFVQINNVNTASVLKTVSRTKKVEEADKVYFCGWRHNNIRCNVTPENLEKTRIAFGDKISNMCCQNNISSCWTENINEEQPPNFNIIKILK